MNQLLYQPHPLENVSQKQKRDPFLKFDLPGSTEIKSDEGDATKLSQKEQMAKFENELERVDPGNQPA